MGASRYFSLRVYDPPECDEAGVPLDWERCRCLDSLTHGESMAEIHRQQGQACPVCKGYGSLKALALLHLSLSLPSNAAKHFPKGPEGSSGWLVGQPEWRCEDCGHPMSEGAWEGPDGQPREDWLIENFLRPGHEPWMGDQEWEDVYGIHFSPCDEWCRHEGPTRTVVPGADDQPGIPIVEASWRQVDVRTLGWPHDLRPEQLACLCLRCYAERTKT